MPTPTDILSCRWLKLPWGGAMVAEVAGGGREVYVVERCSAGVGWREEVLVLRVGDFCPNPKLRGGNL
jgi:hypothetical protein